MAQSATDGPRTLGRGEEMDDTSSVIGAQESVASLPGGSLDSAGVLAGGRNRRAAEAGTVSQEMTDPHQRSAARTLSAIVLRMIADGRFVP